MMKWIFKKQIVITLCVCVCVISLNQPVIDLTGLGFPNDFVGTR